jgi:hypothetical protein
MTFLYLWPWLALSLCLTGAYASEPPATVTHATSPSEIVNAHLPQWVRLTGEVRFREEGFIGNRFTAGNDDMYLLQRFRLGLEVRPTPWLSFYAQAQDSRVSFPTRVSPAPPFQDSADLRQAFLQVGGETKPFLVRVGRQELAFGEERLVGAGNWGNIARSFDAIRAGFHGSGYRVDAFAASVVVARDHTFDKHTDGDNLHGIYGQFEKLVPRAKVEPFFFWRLSPSVLAESGSRGRLDSKTVGVRWVGTLPSAYEYTMELAAQRGSWGSDDVQAWAGFWRLGRRFANAPWEPGVRLEFNHASGDDNPGDRRHGTFDVLYPTPHDKYGLADQVGWKNINHIGIIGEVKPRAGLVLQVKAHDWWLANARDGLYNSGGTLLVRDVTGRSGTHVGEEIDGQVLWTASKHVAIGGGIGHMFAGSFLKRTTPGSGYTFPYVQLIYGL